MEKKNVQRLVKRAYSNGVAPYITGEEAVKIYSTSVIKEFNDIANIYKSSYATA